MYLKPTFSSKCRDLLLFILTFFQHFLLFLVRTQLCLYLDKVFSSNKHRCILQWFFFSHCVVWKSMSTTRQLTPTGVEIQKGTNQCFNCESYDYPKETVWWKDSVYLFYIQGFSCFKEGRSKFQTSTKWSGSESGYFSYQFLFLVVFLKLSYLHILMEGYFGLWLTCLWPMAYLSLAYDLLVFGLWLTCQCKDYQVLVRRFDFWIIFLNWNYSSSLFLFWCAGCWACIVLLE